jgi:polyferredoxin
VVFAGLLLPPLTRRNLYCSHLCPHGAAQQLLKHRIKTQWQLPKRVSQFLKWLPGSVLLLAVGATVSGQSWNLAAWEPFNAWIWYVAGTSSLVLAIGSLAVSTVIPMAWCRYGCATGRLLEYARRSAIAHHITKADFAAATLTAVAIATLLRS